MLNCIIIEDQPPAQRILQKYISEVEILSLKGTFPDAIKAKYFMDMAPVDVIFLDIHLPKMSGIDFLKSVPNHPKVILTTAFSEYALESYAFNVVDYLLKPISYERFLQAISKLKLNINETTEGSETIILKSGYEHIRLLTSEVIYIKSDSYYTEVTTLEKTYISNDSLKQWLEKLDNNYFCQVHKSYLINIQHLIKVSGNIIYLTNTTLPLGRAFKKYFMDTYLK
ncbi:LytR/AlgR family response regulator transcription factor [Flavivirga jejuensis]|uniref:LytTR family DNA-binding domain-containing protein n=1 Tax=Flavivirga jejuensis TaxID=870487 RepID=A0ABT8WSC9_9FLAO|nr:LytTR family DNA-binding domain-containing protein [Flavivirga jejuensis]MDO5976085.1 LytTR family DNA-binding domain-containing protein [Flavivirga jejuensis]